MQRWRFHFTLNKYCERWRGYSQSLIHSPSVVCSVFILSFRVNSPGRLVQEKKEGSLAEGYVFKFAKISRSGSSGFDTIAWLEAEEGPGWGAW